MKFVKLFSILLTFVLLFACSTTKKNKSAVSAAPSATTPETANNTTTVSSAPKIKPLDGIYEPGEEEVNAMRMQYMSITLETLREGHALYIGTCTNCHKANNIYRYSEKQWNSIMEDMSARAKLSKAQQDAVYKYVLSIKATQL